MVKINRFNEFENTLYVFDFDDTLVESPSFEDIAKNYIKESSVKSSLEDLVRSINVKLTDLKWENGRLFINDPNQNIEEVKNWKRKGNRLYLLSPDNFCFMDESLPKELKELSKLYNSVEDCCIVTARPESMRSKIIEVLSTLGLKDPKYGLHMCPNNKIDAGTWKGKKIVELATNHKFKKAIFYDDNSKYIRKAKKVVLEELPNLDFKTIKVL